MNDDQQRQALFWHRLLSPLLWGEIPPQRAGDFLRELAEKEHVFPDGSRRKISRATLWRKWKQLRDGGFSALARKPRRDRGQSRANSEAMLQRAVELKKDQPYRSAEAINQFLQAEFGRTLPKSTLYRHLRKAGATRSKLGIDRRKVRRRWTREHSNVLWVGDFADGPYVMQDGQSRPTYLSAFIDCHSRLAVEARYYFRENFDVLIDSLLRAWASHGASRELYVDNARIYHAQGLQAACAHLNIRLRHRPVRDPAAGGLVERLIQTLPAAVRTRGAGRSDSRSGPAEPGPRRLAGSQLPPARPLGNPSNARGALRAGQVVRSPRRRAVDPAVFLSPRRAKGGPRFQRRAFGGPFLSS